MSSISVLEGAVAWSASFVARRFIAAKLYKNDLNKIFKDVDRDINFAMALASRERTQYWIKGFIPVGIGVLGILGGIGEMLVGNVEPAIFFLYTGALHLSEGRYYQQQQKKKILFNERNIKDGKKNFLK